MKPLILALAAGMAFAQQGGGAIKGKVAETIDAGKYTYVRVATAQGDRWAAVPQAALKKGAAVRVNVEMVMDKFESPTLHRTFDGIAFGTLAGAAPAHPYAAPAKELSTKPVEKAQGPDARRVSELYAKKNELKGKTVVVRGRVVKYNSGILNANWLHLRDGSGTEKGKNNDVAVATQDGAALGDVITVSGSVTLDKDVGAGYFFPVLIENAKIVKR